MSENELTLRAYLTANVALASVTALKETILETNELKTKFEAKYKAQLSLLMKDLEATLGEKEMSGIVASLKEKGLL